MYTVVMDYNEENYERLTIYNEFKVKMYEYLEGEVLDELKIVLSLLNGHTYTVIDNRYEANEEL